MFDTSTFDDPFVLEPVIRRRWAFMETSSAAAVLRSVCPNEWADIVHVLSSFELDPKQWLRAGGNRGDIAQVIDGMFSQRGWKETRVDLSTQGILLSKKLEVIERLPAVHQEGYLVDNFKGRVALDVEWNAKDGNLDRDLSAYRAWHEAGVISAAVLITQDRVRLKQLAETLWFDYQQTLPEAQRNSKLPIDLNTSTTTNLEKAALRVRRGVMGTCPLLIVAATPETWNGQPYR
ncbi:BglII/BstYI family type II restriction endonuclease [Herbaspirillum rubrisubalbicans]|uniref:BglII/BstYI family type II restriction endonuclease n=1 Tax=Herbaspirillum rubrisubalbicans TaxID=80842 RepID=UPI0015C54375|nr:BglII/BstYI family type II restriction endonuclease [Herbaspirillum rubrisubalbicans]NQE51156.1 restriction endonuclease BglII [Herbaspirillum rubrisubalbicans]